VYFPGVSSFRRVALVQSHQRLVPVHAYYLNDLVELCGLASFIRDDVDRVDLPVSPSDRDPLATFERYVKRNRPDLVGISSFTCGANPAREYARIASQAGAFVVAGGFHPSASPEEVLGWPGVEAVVRGEGEHALRELVRTGSPDGIPGFSYRSGGGFVHQPVPPVIEDLDALPMPARELRPERFGLSGLDYHTDTIFGSRGCRGRCRFCANHLVGREWRVRGNESLMRELLTITPPRSRRHKFVKFWDSNFLADAARVEELAKMIRSAGLHRWFQFIVETRVEDIIRAAPILKTMQQAGFVRVGCGVESPNRSTHRSLGKGINLDHVGTAAALIAGAGIQFTKFLIIGHSDESRDDILAYPEFALSHGTTLQKTTVFVMTPYPGTELAADYVERGAVTSFNRDLYNNFGAVVEAGGMSSLELQGLLFAVSAGIALSVRLRKGRTLPQAFIRIFEPLFVAVTMARMGDRFSRDEVVATLMEMLERLPVTLAGDGATPGRKRFGRRVAMRIHAPGRPSVVLGVVEEAGVERFRARAGDERLQSGGRPMREVHISLPQVVELIEKIDHRRIAHDVTTLRWKPRAFKLRWIPSFVRQVGVVLLSALRAIAFHVRNAR